MKKFLGLSLLLFAHTSAFAQVHTWHNVSANSSAFCQLAPVLDQDFGFVDQNKLLITNFSLAALQNYTYGLKIGEKTSFDLLYTLACRKADGSQQNTPRVVFVVGAKGPAQPDISTLNYNGAVGTWQTVPGIGENFEIKAP